MASRAEQKAAARAAREAKQQELRAAATRRQRLMALGGMLTVAVVALIVVIVVSTGGGAAKNVVKVPKSAQSAALAAVNATLAGIPQSGNVLGNPKAPVTITEYGDLVCPTCADFAVTTEPQIIDALVRTGKAKLVYRAFETASGTANGSEFINTQVAARAAGLQGKEWNYILLTYEEQPATINGTPAEEVAYVNTAYLQSRAAQIKGLNLVKWQAHTTASPLVSAVKSDETAALSTGAKGTPAVYISGPKGTVMDPEVVPSLAKVEQLVAQVS
jgi:protein-disulfide isomerase